MFRISRYWNRLAFKIAGIGLWMVWDLTQKNQNLIDDAVGSKKFAKWMLT